jgi:hypothetical protein
MPQVGKFVWYLVTISTVELCREGTESAPATGSASTYVKNSRFIDLEDSFFIIHPNRPQKAAEKTIVKTRITVNMVLNRSASIPTGISRIICGNIVNCKNTPKTIHAIPSHIIAINTIRPQFFLFRSPIEEINNVEDMIKNEKKNKRICDDMNLKNAGISSAPEAFEISLKCEGSNMRPIIMFWAIEMKVENPVRAMKTHARAVTKLDRLASDSNSILLSMPND